MHPLPWSLRLSPWNTTEVTQLRWHVRVVLNGPQGEAPALHVAEPGDDLPIRLRRSFIPFPSERRLALEVHCGPSRDAMRILGSVMLPPRTPSDRSKLGLLLYYADAGDHVAISVAVVDSNGETYDLGDIRSRYPPKGAG
jgi:hypothetical protein